MINGTEEATKELKKESERILIDCKEVIAPRVGERVDATSVTSLYKVRIKDSLYNSLPFVKVIESSSQREYSVSFLDGKIHILSDALPILEEIPKQQQQQLGHDAVFIGDLKLSDFKLTLSKSNNFQVTNTFLEF